MPITCDPSKSRPLQRRGAAVPTAIAAALLALGAAPADAADFWWNCGGSNPWGGATCWNNGSDQGPGPNDDAYLLGDASANITVQYKDGFNYTVNHLFIGANVAYSTVTLQQTGGTLTTSNSMWVGNANYSAKVSISGGSLVSHGGLYIGNNTLAGSTSSFTVSGPETGANATKVNVGSTGITLGGKTGDGVVRQSGGTVTTTALDIAGANSGYTVSGGTLGVSGPLQVGANALSGQSFMSLSGTGTIKADTPLILGGAAASGQMRQSGGTLQVKEIHLDNAGSSYTMSGGTINAGNGVLLLTGAGSSSFSGGTVQGSVTNQARMTVGGALALNSFTNDANGVFSMRQGGQLQAQGTVQNKAGASFALGGGSIVLAGNKNFANYGSFSGSGTVTANQFINYAGASVAVSGGDLSFNSATGLVNSSGAMLSISGQHVVFTSTGTVWNNDGSIDLGGKGTLVPADTIVNRGQIYNGGSVVAATITNQGTITANGSQALFLSGPNTQNAGTITVAPTLANPARNGSLDGALITNLAKGFIGGSGSIRNDIVNLQGGTYAVDSQGQLDQQGAYDARAGSITRLGDGATLTFEGATSFAAGTGITGNGQTRFAGTLEVGGGFGSALVAGGASFQRGSSYIAGLGDGGQGVAASKLVVGKLLGFGGTLTLVSNNGFVAQVGQSFDLFDFGASNGKFTKIDTSGLSLANGARLNLDKLYVDGTISVVTAGGNLAPVPEPATWASLAAGLALLAGVRLRQSRARP